MFTPALSIVMNDSQFHPYCYQSKHRITVLKYVAVMMVVGIETLKTLCAVFLCAIGVRS